MRFVDCTFELEAELSDGRLFKKRGATDPETGKVISVCFDQMEDIAVWQYIHIECKPILEPEPSVHDSMENQSMNKSGRNSHMGSI